MTNLTVSSKSQYEKLGNYARGRRVGDHVFVSGTAAVDAQGVLQAPGDTYAQSVYVFSRIEETLHELGASMSHVVRTRAYVTDIDTIDGYVKAHGEAFKGILPTATGVAAAGLVLPGMMVEVDVDAIVTHDA